MYLYIGIVYFYSPDAPKLEVSLVKARTQEVGTTESVRDLSVDGLSSKDKAIILVQPHHPLLFS